MMPRSACVLLFLLVTIAFGPAGEAKKPNLHQQLLDLAVKQESQRRERFSAVRTRADLEALQKSLRERLLTTLDGLPEAKGPPPVRALGKIEAEDHIVEKLVFESFPGYFVPALLYRPKKQLGPAPGVISPCGHSAVGKAAAPYQTLHLNLVKRGYVVLTYDPVGQGERSQFWDQAKQKSRFNLVCGEHAVLGNPLYLLGTNLARYRIWDGIRAIDYLASRPEVDRERLGCVGNSGGGTLTAYIAALDPRVKAAAIGCYITTLPRRMATRTQTDPDADPEQDLVGYLSEGIDHAGLLALRAPRPTLIASAKFDFFPIEGARESYGEAKKLFEVVGTGEAIKQVEAAEKHGLSLPLRQAIYGFFERWLKEGKSDQELVEIPVQPRPTKDLLVTAEGQVNVTLQSRHLLTLALAEFDRKPKGPRQPLAKLLRLDPEAADFRLTELASGEKGNATLVLCVQGNESRPWQEEKGLIAALTKAGHRVVLVEPRGVGKLRPDFTLKGRDYADPLDGVEENQAYNAFLVGKSLIGMRVSDVQTAVRQLTDKDKSARVVLLGRRDAALVACFAAAVEPSVARVGVEEMPLSYRNYFDPRGRPINAASILPEMLREFGDIEDLLKAIAPRSGFVAAGVGKMSAPVSGITSKERPFTEVPQELIDWMSK